MREEPTPFGPEGRFVSSEHFPGHDDDVDFNLSAEERSDLAREKDEMEDAILEAIDNPYTESTEFEEEMRESEKIQKEEEEKRRGWKTNFKSSSGDEYPTESEAEILDHAIKEAEKPKAEEHPEHPTLKEIRSTKESKRRFLTLNRLRRDSKTYKTKEERDAVIARRQKKEKESKEITKAQRQSPKNQ